MNTAPVSVIFENISMQCQDLPKHVFGVELSWWAFVYLHVPEVCAECPLKCPNGSFPSASVDYASEIPVPSHRGCLIASMPLGNTLTQSRDVPA
jgi:hypothetical protein